MTIIISRRNFDVPTNPFQVERNELLNKNIIDYINSISLEIYKIAELSTIFKEIDIILLGAPGVGKSSLIRLLIWDVLLEINRNKNPKFNFLEEYLYSNSQEIPFFGFYINLYDDLSKNFYGTRLKKDEWNQLFIYYFSLFVISRFIRNLKLFFNKIKKKGLFHSDISWKNENLPSFICKTRNLDELKQKINDKMIDIEKFLTSYSSIEEKKQKLRFYSSEFFSFTIEDIVNSIDFNINRIILVIDDLSWLPNQLIAPILSLMGKRFKNLEIKLISRAKPHITEKLSSFDRRDVISIDLDYILINNYQKKYYNKMAKDIVRERLRNKGYFLNKVEDVFPELDVENEAKFYAKKIDIIQNDVFFNESLKNVKVLYNKQDLLRDLIKSNTDFTEQSLEVKFKEFGIEPLIISPQLVKKINILLKLYNQIKSYNNPVERKINEILAARIFKGDLNRKSIPEIYNVFTKVEEDIQKSTNLISISLHHLARESNQIKIYAGFNQIVQISSYVIKDFLEILEKIFKKYFLRQIKQYGSIYDQPIVPWEIQSEAIHEYGENKVKNYLTKNTKYGSLLYTFFQALDLFFKDQYNIKASYQNGRTGFAFSTIDDYLKLKEQDFFNEAIANSFIISKDISKGFINHQKKSDFVFYVHRSVCVFYNWPIDLGGYKYTNYEDIINFLIKGNKPPSKRVKESLINFLHTEND